MERVQQAPVCRKCGHPKQLQKNGRHWRCAACERARRAEYWKSPAGKAVRARFRRSAKYVQYLDVRRKNGTAKEYNRQWHQKNRESQREKGMAWRHASPERPLYWHAKRRARVRGIEFTITLDDVVIPKRCPILGIVLTSPKDRGLGSRCRHSASSPSLDRIDNTKGYVPGNVWVISHRANTIKSDASLRELEQLVRALRRKLTPRLVRRAPQLLLPIPPPREPLPIAPRSAGSARNGS